MNATNITSYINGQGQISLSGLDNTTPNDDEWYGVTVPSSTTGQMKISVQTANLSSLAPELMIYNSSYSLITSASSTSTAGVTISATLSVTSGQKYYFKVLTAGSGTVGTVGAYGLLVNFGSQSQSPVAPPDTVVTQQPDGGGGTINNARLAGAAGDVGASATGTTGDRQGHGKDLAAREQAVRIKIGGLTGLVDGMDASATRPHGGRALVLDQVRVSRKLDRLHRGPLGVHADPA